MLLRSAICVVIVLVLGVGAMAEPAERVASDAAKLETTAEPDLAASLATRSSRTPLELPPQERLRIAFLTAFGLIWFFWLGAAMGSYLNVVVFRMPLGLPSVAPDSRCPKCQTPIRWYDNIPVFSWLVLRGRCRACQLPIAARYVIIETVMGSLFVGLLCVEVLSGGANLPVRAQRQFVGLPMIEHFMEWDLLGIYLFHVTLIWFLVGTILFRIDKHIVPKRFINWGVMIGILLPTIWPWLRPDVFVVGTGERWSAFWTGVFGATLALFLLTFVVRSAMNCASRSNLIGTLLSLVAETMPPLVIVGAFLGWRAVTSIVCWSMIVLILRRLISLIFPRHTSWPIAVVILIATILHLGFWNTMTGCPWWPGPETSLLRMVAMLIVLAAGLRSTATFAASSRRHAVGARTN